MLIITGRESHLLEFLNNQNISHRGPVTLVTGNKILFKSKTVETQRKENGMRAFFAETIGASLLPRRSFGIAVVDQVMIHNEVNLTLLSQSVNAGVIFPYFVPAGFSQFFLGMQDYRREIEAQERVKARRKEMEEEWKKQKDEWKILKNQIKEENDVKLAEFEEMIKSVPEAARQYMTPPPLREIPPKPEEPRYPEMPRVAGVQDRFHKPQNSLVWKVLRRFEYLQVKGTNLGLLKKREQDLTFNIENLESLSTGEISVEEFYEFVNKSNVNSASSNDMKQSFADPAALELFAEMDFSIEELVFSEETEESVILPPLAPIKPMHAASMLAGGIGEYYREVMLHGERVAIKAAIVKEPTTRTTVINGREIKETIEQQIQKLGVYNIDRREFKLLG